LPARTGCDTRAVTSERDRWPGARVDRDPRQEPGRLAVPTAEGLMVCPRCGQLVPPVPIVDYPTFEASACAVDLVERSRRFDAHEARSCID
jgi:hypothetical protein